MTESRTGKARTAGEPRTAKESRTPGEARTPGQANRGGHPTRGESRDPGGRVERGGPVDRTSDDRVRPTTVRRALWAGPLMYVAGVLAIYGSGQAGGVGPLDAGQLGALVGLPLILLAPGVFSLAWAELPIARLAGRLLRVLAVVVGAGVGLWLALVTTEIACVPISSPVEAVIPSTLMGVLSGIAFAVPVVLASREGRGRPRIWRLLIGAVAMVIGGWVVIAVGVYWLFPVLTCPAS